ncbi:MAG TPA: DUF1800 domain-containing protein [Gemmatimonadaceae bacterium]|nr:DUF1800 domain-containing protein [Gemmatimonadaceae bacterium]
MRRFGSFVIVVLAIGAAGTVSARSVSGTVRDVTSTLRELTEREQAVHVLNRLAFGPRPGDVERVMRVGVDRWVEAQLHPERVDDRQAARALAAFPLVQKSASELLRTYPPPGAVRVQSRLRGDTLLSARDSAELRRQGQRAREFVSDLLAAKVARAVVSERQLEEVLVDFWENHFSVFIGKGQVRYYLPEYTRQAIRPHVLGEFRDLLGAVAKSPAMLFYLDNAQSVADSTQPTLAQVRRGGRQGAAGRVGRAGGAGRGVVIRRPGAVGQRPMPRVDSARMAAIQQAQQRRPRGLNENYARELLELHTLGVDGGYTQHDVIHVARALTGWSISPPRSGRAGFVFRPEAHDAGEKVVLGHRLRAGRGIEDGEDVLNILARHPSTARFIARKLAIRLVSDSPPEELVDRAAAAFTRTNGNIREVVRTIVTSPEFYSRAAYRSKVKSPFEVTVSALRALGAQADTSALSAGLVARLGQPLYGRQTPDGWPETGSEWMNTGAILNRINFGLMVATGRIPGAPLRSWPQYDALVTATRAAQVDGVIESFLAGRASSDTREILLSGQNPLADRAAADSSLFRADDDGARMAPGGRRGAGRGGRAAALGRVPALAGLPQVIGLALGSPEFQRR